MKILAIGDIVGKAGCEFIRTKLNEVRNSMEIDFVVANGENSAEGNGVTPQSAISLFRSGVDVITLGNHSFRRREVYPFLNETPNIIRPANYPSSSTPGRGFCKVNVNGIKICIINIMGVMYLESLNCPFRTLDRIIEQTSDCAIRVVDFHAEATAEKLALGYYADGRVSAFFGTHTHVQTSDEVFLPNGTGYITDVGMTGVIYSVLGVKREISIKKMKDKLPLRFENAEGVCRMECIVFDIDEHSGKTVFMQRLRVMP